MRYLEDLIWGVKKKETGEYFVNRMGNYSTWTDDAEFAFPFASKCDAWNTLQKCHDAILCAFDTDDKGVRREVPLSELVKKRSRDEAPDDLNNPALRSDGVTQ